MCYIYISLHMQFVNNLTQCCHHHPLEFVDKATRGQALAQAYHGNVDTTRDRLITEAVRKVRVVHRYVLLLHELDLLLLCRLLHLIVKIIGVLTLDPR